MSEVLIGTCIFAISIVGISQTFRHGVRIIGDMNHKKIAYNNAQILLEKYLTFSYEGILDLIDHPVQTTPGCQVVLENKKMPGADSTKSDIPYCTIQVACAYGTEEPQKTVGFSGIIPYPYLHLLTDTRTGDNEAAVGADAFIFNAPFVFDVEVHSSLMIFYNITFEVIDNGIPVLGTDLVKTQAYFKKAADSDLTSIGLQTVTSLLTQPTISNVIVVGREDVRVGKSDPNSVTISWMKTGDGGVVRAKKVHLIIVQIEDN